MATLTEILNLAKTKAQIIGHYQYGHNLLQSPVQINEIFSMLDTIINDVMKEIGDIIPDINLAPYKEGAVDSTRANLCWVKLKENYYGLILNMQRGIKYREFTKEDLQKLLLTGQLSSWYLISKIQNLSYMCFAEDANSDETMEYFRSLITDIVERFFIEHESDKTMHPAGIVNLAKLDAIFSKIQIQNTNSIVPSMASTSTSNTAAKWSQSIIKTPTHEICWQSAAAVPLYEMTPGLVDNVIQSEYLHERSDVEVFLEETFRKRKNNGSLSKPNVFCYLSKEILPVPYINLNYIVECQLHGYIEVEYTDGSDPVKIYPDTMPMILQRGKNDVSFMTVIKLDNNVNKSVKRVITQPSNGLHVLPNLHMTFSITGVSSNI